MARAATLGNDAAGSGLRGKIARPDSLYAAYNDEASIPGAPLPSWLVATVASWSRRGARQTSSWPRCFADHGAAEERDASGLGTIVLPPPIIACNPCSDFPRDPIIDNGNESVVLSRTWFDCSPVRPVRARFRALV